MTDIDELLNEFELTMTDSKTKTTYSKHCDLDDLLKELDTTVSSSDIQSRTSITKSTEIPSKTTSIKKKCYFLKECENIKCLGCDFQIQSFKQSEWIGVDYLFFRNYMPNRDKLKQKLKTSKNSDAFCCQCSWTNNISDIGKLKWICGGH